MTRQSPRRASSLSYYIPLIVMGIVCVGLLVILARQSHEVGGHRVSTAQTACTVQRIANSFSLQPKIFLPVLMYHYVEYVKDKRDHTRELMNVPPVELERQIQELKSAGYQTALARDIPRILTGKADVCVKAVVLSFDDGYEDFYTDVYPLLKKYHAKGTVYIISNFINRPGFLTEAEIKEMLASGLVEVGSHTLNHYYLKKASVAEQRREIIESKKVLEDRFGIKIETFAYPFGAFDATSVELVKEASYSAAVTVMPGAYLSTDSKYVLPRVRPEKLYGNVADALTRLAIH